MSGSEKTPRSVPQPLADQNDEAVVYLRDHDESVDNVDLRALRRKIDRHLMPYMFCCYVLQFLDKVMLNVRQSTCHRRISPLTSFPVRCRDGIEKRSEFDGERLLQYSDVVLCCIFNRRSAQ